MSIAAPLPYPRATVRLQFNSQFTFEDARSLVPYFASLGFSHVYGSPILLARPGSTHGYDIVDHSRLNPEIGTPEQFDAFVSALHDHGMGFIMDFVPNHMGVGGADNGWWLDVLEWGPASPYARFFDIDWHPFEKSLDGKVLLPVLGDQYGKVLEAGELVLEFAQEEGSFSVFYYTHRFPIALRHYPLLLREVVRLLPDTQSEAARTLNDLSRRAGRLGRGSGRPQKQAIEHAEARDIKGSLAALAAGDESVAEAMRSVVTRYNGTAGDTRSFDELHRLLERQAYRPSYWRVASNEINYRRFFDINTLAAIRMEDPELFELTHGLMFRLLQENKIQGIRLDHVDGLYDPADYFDRLQHRAAYTRIQGPSEGAAARARLDQPLYVLVEKILAHHEALRTSWQVSGTTGYEYMNLSAGLFIDPEGEEAFDSFYREFCDADESFEEMALRAKYRIMTNSLASELNVLANRFNRLAKQSRRTRDFSRIGFRNAIADVVARFPVYRSYVDSHGATDEDRRDIDWAVAQAKKQAAIPDTSIYDFIHDVLTIDLASARQGGRGRREFRRRDVIDLAMRFQQFTGPVTAKSVEDTAFYRYVRFVARNEVGGDPARYYVSPQAFHLENRYRASTLPFGMISTATHDHKRGEDVRMRLAALSEVPEQWRAFVSRMGELSGFFKSEIDGETAPSAADEYLFYQTVVGSWPLDLTGPEYPGLEDYAQRLAAYMLKAAREAKVMTGWTATNEPYEAALTRFVESVLSVRRGRILLREIESFVERVASAGALYSLSQLLLRLTVPGVPDTYQGCDLWDFSLVDPDNRRPVDFVQRRRLREDRAGLARTAVAEELGSHWRDGAIKQYILESVLSFRAERPDLFAAGTYDSLECVGERERSVLAFVRELDGAMLVVAVPRLCSELIDDRGTLKLRGFGDTTVRMPEWSPAAGEERERRLFRSLLDTAQLPLNSGETVAIDALMTGFPLVALYSDPPSGAG